MSDPDPNVEIPVSVTLGAMEAGGVSQTLFLAGNARRVLQLDAGG